MTCLGAYPITACPVESLSSFTLILNCKDLSKDDYWFSILEPFSKGVTFQEKDKRPSLMTEKTTKSNSQWELGNSIKEKNLPEGIALSV